MRFEWEKINILSKLLRLEMLKLGWESHVGKEWKMQEEEIFCELITLIISKCDLKHWKASSHNFPKLEHLLLSNCNELREIPIDFAEISTLKSIKLWACLPSAVKSVKKIQDVQHDSGNYDMVAIEMETLNVLRSEESLSEEESEVDNCRQKKRKALDIWSG
nr:disease resistance protein RPP13-like isoform X2 [Ipomoea trifida]